MHGPIDPADLLREVSDTGLGGTALFLGTVRRSVEDGPVDAIDYSAYDEMAEAELDRILRDGAAQFPGVRMTARHRLGLIPAGEASVAVAAAAPHRAEAFAACRWVIEEVKQRLPVWKRERLEDGSVRWREGGAPAAPPSNQPPSAAH
jgi:molybdopterin synthase catalytic subunit